MHLTQSDEEVFVELLGGVERGELLSAVLSAPQKRTQLSQKLSIRAILIKDTLFYQLTDQVKQKALHRNVQPKECAKSIKEGMFSHFGQGIFTFKEVSFHVLMSKDNKMKVLQRKVSFQNTLPMTHNREKQYVLKEGEPIDFLVALQIMTKEGKVIAKKYDKFRQINRFLEMISDVCSPLLEKENIEVIDFGCGKAYLTFALYYYMHNILGKPLHIKGLDLKEDVIIHCKSLVKSLGYQGLKFAVGDIKDEKPTGKVDMVISLHACDTATDVALEKAHLWGADVIMCVPCCQHELYSQIKNPNLDTLLRHGILRERFASLVTDAARAELMTYLGYDVQVIEFIDMEHTPKNLLIRCIKSKAGKESLASNAALNRYKKFKEALSIQPTLENLFP